MAILLLFDGGDWGRAGPAGVLEMKTYTQKHSVDLCICLEAKTWHCVSKAVCFFAPAAPTGRNTSPIAKHSH
jgi:hypothetical protein